MLRWHKLALAAFGVILAGVITLAALPLLRPSAGCTPAPGDWYWQVFGVTGAYREVCGEFPITQQEQGFPAFWRFNNYGLNDSDYTLEKPPGVFRIVVVGDSFPQALQVEREQGFTWLLEDMLNTDSPRRIEVINLSVDAYGTDRELLLYAALGWRFQPDLVLLSIYTGNDIQDNQIDLEHRRYGYRLNRPYFTQQDGRLRLHNSPTYDAGQHPGSPVFGWLAQMQAAQLPPMPENPPPRPAVLSQQPYIIEYPVELGVFLPEDDYWRDAWALTETLVLAFRDVVEGLQGVPFAAVIIPDRRAIHSADWAVLLDLYAERVPELREADPFGPASRIETFLAASGIPALNLTWALKSEADSSGERLYYADDGHFNARGHAAAARRIALWLEGRRLTP